MAVQKKRLAYAVGLAMAGWLSSLPAHASAAEDAKIKALEQRLEQSLKTIDALTARVNQLEQHEKQGEQAAAAPAPTPAAETTKLATDTRVEELQAQVTQLQTDVATSKQEGIPLHGFADAGLSQVSGLNSAKLPSGNLQYLNQRGFVAGSFDFLLTPTFGRVKALAELTMDYTPDLSGNVGIDMERLQLGYTVDDNNSLWVGRFHTPFGYWNTAFHHGGQLQPTIDRPQFMQFEDHYGVMPVHTVGAWWTGNVKTEAGKVLYDAYLGNSGSVNVDDNNNKILNFNPFTNGDSHKRFGGRLAFETRSGLRVGVHAYSDDIDVLANSSSIVLADTKSTMLGGFAHYEDDNWELIGEYFHFDDNTRQNISGVGLLGSRQSNAWYLQGSYGIGESWFPYLRYERATLNPNDILFAAQSGGYSYDKAMLGVRYNFDARSAFKIEAGHYNIKSGTTLNTVSGPAAETYPGTGYSEVRAQVSTSF